MNVKEPKPLERSTLSPYSISPDPGPRRGPWIVEQTWHNLLFAHWPVTAGALRHAVPDGLAIDTFGGLAWLGIVAFRLSNIRLRGLPALPPVTSFSEINVRTYVVHGGIPGVYFMSLDADHPLAMAIARPWFRLAYSYSRIDFSHAGDECSFDSVRVEPHLPSAEFSAGYRPVSEPALYPPGSLEQWLTERYCYYSTNRRGDLYRCDIYHPPWALQIAEVGITCNSMALAHDVNLPSVPPVCHYARGMKAAVWPVRKVAAGSRLKVAAPAAASR